jgi:hypothetical protein
MNYTVTPILLTLVSPLLVLIVVRRIRITIAYTSGAPGRRVEAPDSRTIGVSESAHAHQVIGDSSEELKPFDPAPEPTPSVFLRNFTLQQRCWIRQQVLTARYGYFTSLWILLVLLTVSLTPQYVNQWSPLLSPYQRALSSYLSNFEVVAIVVGIVAFFTAIIAITTFQVPSQATFSRTRPLPYAFLFFARIGVALAALLAAIVSALVISLSLLFLLYGFRHAIPTDLAIHPSQRDIINFLLLNQTSLPRIILSLLTTAILCFAVLVTLLTVPDRSGNKPQAGILNFVIIFLILLPKGFIRDGLKHHHAHSIYLHSAGIFLYVKPGSPPPWAEALIPLILSAIFLWLAEKFSARTEM